MNNNNLALRIAASMMHRSSSNILNIVDSMRCHFPLSNNNDDEELDTRSSSSKKHSKGLFFSLSVALFYFASSNLLSI
jgi:hypothetical protein